jgi:hypothetical protein
LLVAKISKVNIAITGDSSGLAKASDQAVKDLRRVSAQTERTQKSFSDFKGKANQAAEALGKFGVKGSGLGILGGASGLLSMGGGGLAMAAGGLALGAGYAVTKELLAAIESLPAERKAAIEALHQQQIIGGKSFAELGFTKRIAEGLAAGPAPTAATGMGFSRGLALGFGSENSPQGRIANRLVNDVPGAVGVQVGTLLAGGGMQAAGQKGAETLFGDTTAQQLGTAMTIAADGMAMWNSIKNWWSK